MQVLAGCFTDSEVPVVYLEEKRILGRMFGFVRRFLERYVPPFHKETSCLCFQLIIPLLQNYNGP